MHHPLNLRPRQARLLPVAATLGGLLIRRRPRDLRPLLRWFHNPEDVDAAFLALHLRKPQIHAGDLVPHFQVDRLVDQDLVVVALGQALQAGGDVDQRPCLLGAEAPGPGWQAERPQFELAL